MNRAIALVAAASFACDWQQSALLNSLPITGTRTDDMYVYLAYDGLDPVSVREAMKLGAFSGPQWKTANFITAFPGSSDVSWTRILRAPRLHGYEYEYYDPSEDKLVDSGYSGLAKHILPNLGAGLTFEPDYLKAFDYRSHGYLHNFDVYSDTWLSVNETFDDLFYELDGRAETDSVFIGYIMEGDVLGHTGNRDDCVKNLLRLAARMEQFRADHPKRKIHFTLLSDHGMDFSGQPDSAFMNYEDELPKVGITPVTSLAGHEGVYAVPVLHVRLQYYAMHTTPALVREVARRVSMLESIDFAVGRFDSTHFGIWTNGALDGTVSYADGRYSLEGDFSRFGITGGSSSDEELFKMTKGGRYPDFLYRLRTALSGTSGTEYPADVMVSCKTGFSSAGAIPRPHHADGMSHNGTHGGVNVDGIGALLTEERELPEAVRSDAFLDLFPRALGHLRERGLTIVDPDADALRPL